MSLNQPLLLSSALVHQVLPSPTTYPYKQVTVLLRHLPKSHLRIAGYSSKWISPCRRQTVNWDCFRMLTLDRQYGQFESLSFPYSLRRRH
jgi:hypothetical protein